MEEVLHARDSVDRAGLLDQLLDLVRAFHLAAEVHDAVLDVHVHRAFRRIGGPEDLALHSLRESLIVRGRLLRAGLALRRLGLALHLPGSVLGLPAGGFGTAAEKRQRPIAGDVPSTLAGVGIKEVTRSQTRPPPR